MVLSKYGNAKYIQVFVLNLALHQERSSVMNLVRFVLSFISSIIFEYVNWTRYRSCSLHTCNNKVAQMFIYGQNQLTFE